MTRESRPSPTGSTALTTSGHTPRSCDLGRLNRFGAADAVGGIGRGGTGTEHRWVQPGTNLVVKATNTERDTSPSPIGEVTYKQSYEIILELLEPKR